ncbi:GNAT family N-acetyltransferase [Marinicella sp. W31]|uniref:GNAT family N-acetyltransferase n=1 Tax=Marinicella sp. W31 TaxID=3023713 RepID=UPI0037574108
MKSIDTCLKNLNDVPVETLHQVFLDAFSGYSLNMQMPLLAFKEMLTTRSYKPQYSTGLFLDNKLIGMVLIGVRQANAIKVAYNLTTGISSKYQHLGFGSRVLGTALKRLEKEKCEQVILEVLDDNLSAKTMYEKQGFKKRRGLLCLKCTDLLSVKKKHTPVVIDDVSTEKILLEDKAFLCFEPSWQNAERSYLNSRESHDFIALKNSDNFTAYAMIHTETGKIMQIGLNQCMRKTGVLSELMAHLQSQISSQELYFINVDEAAELKHDLLHIGFKPYAVQSEMIKIL